MNAARVVRYARRRAGLSQRALAEKASVPQSTIGRIESGATDPRASTLDRLLAACGFDLEVEPRLGIGVDRSQLDEMLKRTPTERIMFAGRSARAMEAFRHAKRVVA